MESSALARVTEGAPEHSYKAGGRSRVRVRKEQLACEKRRSHSVLSTYVKIRPKMAEKGDKNDRKITRVFGTILTTFF